MLLPFVCVLPVLAIRRLAFILLSASGGRSRRQYGDT